ncbi:MAG: response regulator, partial [Actinomycetota bacterium]
TRDGYNLGTLCILDRKPRTLSDQDIRTLEDLAAIVMHDLEQRLESRRSALPDSNADKVAARVSVGSSHGEL